MIFDIFTIIWNWKIEPIPVILALIFYHIPSIWRKYKRSVYTPVYFTIPPLARYNKQLSRYIGDSWLGDFIEDDNEAEKLRKKTIVISWFSFAIDIMLVPTVFSIIFGLILSKEQFYTSVSIICLITVFRFIKSYKNFYKYYDVIRNSFKKVLFICYTICLFMIFYAMIKTYQWAEPFITSKNYAGLIFRISDLIYSFIPNFITTSIFPFILSGLFDPKVRAMRKEQERSYAETAATIYDDDKI